MATPKKTSTKAPAKSSASKAPAKSTAKTPKPTKKAPAKKEVKETQPKPATAKTQPKAAKAPAAKPKKETLTAEEKARLTKLKATLALLKADPEWPAFIEAQKEALHELRATLVPNMNSVTRDHLRSGDSNVSSSSGQHIGDAGSEAEVRELTIRLLDKDREQLYEIDAALERIRRGTYGICEISLEPIPKGRLRVRPFCRLTVKCQEEYEKKYGSYANYRAKNSDHVGFAGLQNDIENAISLDDSEE